MSAYSDGEGFDKFNYKKEMFKHFKRDPNDLLNSLGGSEVFAITRSINKKLLIGTYGGGRDIFDPLTEKYTHITHDPDDSQSLSGNSIMHIHKDKKGAIWIGTNLFILITFCVSNAQVPQLINYQGMVTDGVGTPINGSYDIVFKIYKAETGGTELWAETQSVLVTNGLINVLLGSVTPIPYSVFENDEKYLALKIGEVPEMIP